MSQVYVVLLVNMDVHVYVYGRLRLFFHRCDNILVDENACAHLPADVRTEYESALAIDMEGTNEKASLVLVSVAAGTATGGIKR